MILALSPFLQGGCGGGGGGGGGNGIVNSWGTTAKDVSPEATATLTQENAAEPAEVLSVVPLIGEVVVMGSASSGTARALSAESRSSIFANLQSLINRAAGEVQQGNVHALSSSSKSRNCNMGSESISMSWDGPDMALIVNVCSEVNNIKMDLTFNNCTKMGATIDGTMSISIPDSLCNITEGTPSSMSITMNGTIYDLSEGLTADFDQFSIEVSNLVINGLYDVGISQMDAIINGGVAGTIDGESGSIAFNDFSLHLNEEYDVAGHGYYYSTTLDGLVQTTCLDGWVKITTTTPIAIPDNFDNCPFAGNFEIEGSDATATITALDFGGVDISLNGVTTSYATCDEVPSSCLQ